MHLVLPKDILHDVEIREVNKMMSYTDQKHGFFIVNSKLFIRILQIRANAQL